MSQIDTVYGFLRQTYKDNEPIFLSDLNIPGVKSASVRQIMKKLMLDGRIKRFDTGIYYFPKKSMFRSGSTLSIENVIKKKYMTDGTGACGYFGGLLFANQIGITTQVSIVYEIYTNKAATDYRKTELAGLQIIIRKLYVPVNEKNADVLQFLDLLKDITDISELEGKELTDKLLEHMRKTGIDFKSMKQYLPYYPERIYRNMYEVGLLIGVSV